MGKNPFKTALNTLYVAGEIGYYFLLLYFSMYFATIKRNILSIILVT